MGWKLTVRSPTPTLRIGDRVSWNSEAGVIHGTVTRIHTQKVDWHGYVHHATIEEPQYELRSDQTGHVALHKGSALRREQN